MCLCSLWFRVTCWSQLVLSLKVFIDLCKRYFENLLRFPSNKAIALELSQFSNFTSLHFTNHICTLRLGPIMGWTSQNKLVNNYVVQLTLYFFVISMHKQVHRVLLQKVSSLHQSKYKITFTCFKDFHY